MANNKIFSILEKIAKAEKANGAFEPTSPLEREQIDYLYTMGLINLYEFECAGSNCVVTLNDKGEKLLRKLQNTAN